MGGTDALIGRSERFYPRLQTENSRRPLEAGRKEASTRIALIGSGNMGGTCEKRRAEVGIKACAGFAISRAIKRKIC
jgi:hypothetical protein